MRWCSLDTIRCFPVYKCWALYYDQNMLRQSLRRDFGVTFLESGEIGAAARPMAQGVIPLFLWISYWIKVAGYHNFVESCNVNRHMAFGNVLQNHSTRQSYPIIELGNEILVVFAMSNSLCIGNYVHITIESITTKRFFIAAMTCHLLQV